MTACEWEGTRLSCETLPLARASLGRTSQLDMVFEARNLLLGDSEYSQDHFIHSTCTLSLTF